MHTETEIQAWYVCVWACLARLAAYGRMEGAGQVLGSKSAVLLWRLERLVGLRLSMVQLLAQCTVWSNAAEKLCMYARMNDRTGLTINLQCTSPTANVTNEQCNGHLQLNNRRKQKRYSAKKCFSIWFTLFTFITLCFQHKRMSLK